MSIQHRRNPELFADELASAERDMQIRTGLGMPNFILEMMEDAHRAANARHAAGWDGDEGGWYSPTGIHESEWEEEGFPFPEDAEYAEFISLQKPVES